MKKSTSVIIEELKATKVLFWKPAINGALPTRFFAIAQNDTQKGIFSVIPEVLN